jgi:hypothetical protein
MSTETETETDLLAMCRELINEGNYEIIRLSRKTIKFLDKRLDLSGKRSHSIRITFPTADEADLVWAYRQAKSE